MRQSPLTCLIVAVVLAACGSDSTASGPGGTPGGPLLAIQSGDNQVDTVAHLLALPLTVVLKDTAGVPVAGATVTWGVVSGGGSIAATGLTDPDGVASAQYTLGHRAGLNSVRAYTNGMSGLPVFFTLTAVHDRPSRLVKFKGDSQVGAIGAALSLPYSVRTTDRFDNGVSGITVTWTSTVGAGQFTTGTSNSDTAGVASATLILGDTLGRQAATATVAGFAGSPITFSATGQIAVTPVPIVENYGLHDSYVRDGIAFECAWNSGLAIFDVGGGPLGGSPTNPKQIGGIITSDNGVPGGPQVHNAWWFHNPVTGEKRYVFIGQEGPGIVGSGSTGDIHVVDVSNMAQPVEVAFYHMPGAGTHNFWMDEPAQILFAAYYNGGVIALDVSGTLSGSLAGRELARVVPGAPDFSSVWGVHQYNGSVYATDIVNGFYQLGFTGTALPVLAGGHNVPGANRISTDLWIANGYAYTGTSGPAPDPLLIWQLGPTGAPILTDSVIPAGDNLNISDVEVSPSGKLLMFSTEYGAGKGIYFYGLADPIHPALLYHHLVPTGVHTTTFGVINNRLYAFAAQNPSPAHLLILDVTRLDR